MGSIESRQISLEYQIKSKIQLENLEDKYNDLILLSKEILNKINGLSTEIKELKINGIANRSISIDNSKLEIKQRESKPFIPMLNDIDMKTSVSDPIIKVRESNMEDSLKKLSKVEKIG